MSPIRMSKLESAIRIVLDFHQALNRHDVAGMMQLMSDECVFENTIPAPDGTVYSGKEAVTGFWVEFFHQQPCARFEIEEIFSLGERCVMRWKLTWQEETGNPGTLRGVNIFRVTEGAISQMMTYVKGGAVG